MKFKKLLQLVLLKAGHYIYYCLPEAMHKTQNVLNPEDMHKTQMPLPRIHHLSVDQSSGVYNSYSIYGCLGNYGAVNDTFPRAVNLYIATAILLSTMHYHASFPWHRCYSLPRSSSTLSWLDFSKSLKPFDQGVKIIVPAGPSHSLTNHWTLLPSIRPQRPL